MLDGDKVGHFLFMSYDQWCCGKIIQKGRSNLRYKVKS